MTDHPAEDALRRAERERDAALARLRTLEDERDVQAREALRHLRNMLSVVRALAARTAEETQAVDDFRAVFDARLTAFARVQSAIARDVDAGIDLGAILDDELLSFGPGVGERVEISGEPVRITSRAAGLLALAVHEIVARFAIGRESAAARAIWSVADGLTIDWFQPIGPERDWEPLPDWVRQAVAYELKGRVSEERSDGEFRCRIELPPGAYFGSSRSS